MSFNLFLVAAGEINPARYLYCGNLYTWDMFSRREMVAWRKQEFRIARGSHSVQNLSRFRE